MRRARDDRGINGASPSLLRVGLPGGGANHGAPSSKSRRRHELVHPAEALLGHGSPRFVGEQVNHEMVTSVKVVYVASSGLTDYAACFLGAGFSAFGSSSGSSRLMVM